MKHTEISSMTEVSGALNSGAGTESVEHDWS